MACPMLTMFDIDWRALLVPTESLAEIAVRGTCIYLILFLVIRFLPRRTMGEASTADILIIVLIADAVQNAMSGDYKTITEGLFLAAVIIGWAVIVDWLDHRFPDMHITAGKPILL